ncbi:Gryzun, putative trafficking through golgi-domain-containing protein, partial [Podospora appendiculata]
MDEYPPYSLDHNIPFLLAVGVSGSATYDSASALSPALKEQAILIRSELPPLEAAQAHALLRYIQDRDASQIPCNEADNTSRRYRFRVRTAERSFLLPPRRARLPDGFETSSPSTPAVLHSPFSPLSPASSLYPNGLVDTRWIRKHQDLIPGVLLCFYTLASDPTLATLCDNQIKTDVNNIRGLLGQSGYKTRLAVVLLSDQLSASIDGIQDRINNIQRVCGIDAKSFFLVPPSESQEELERMAENMLINLQTVALEYYRDLGRHARKKKSRGVAPQPTVPPTSGTSQTLSLAGWNVRYDFKSAMFAEYRLEMETALRSYEQCYENLLSSELMELIPSWSPRWNEARLLADIIAVRCLRCLLWNGHHSAASRRWQFHRDRISDFVDRRGRGTSNYGWQAWEARWAMIMADLIEKADIPDFAPSSLTIYLNPEKSVMGERLQPWELLHHRGYWYRLAAKHLYARRAFARAMPEDDRRPPGSSPASYVASKAFTYDTYMCPDPHEEYPINPDPEKGVDHSSMIVDCLIRARAEFLKRQQIRFAAELSLECAKELAIIKDWPSIVELLRTLWRSMSFRAEGWVVIAEDLSWTLRTAAAMVGEADLVVAIDWELLDRSFTRRTNWHYNITRSLEGITPQSRPVVRIGDGQIVSFVSATFLFKDDEGKAGQSVQGQLSIKSNAQHGSAPIVLSSLEVGFRGSIHKVILRHQADAKITQQSHGSAFLATVSLTDATEEREEEETDEDSSSSEKDGSGEVHKKATLQGEAYLVLLPGQTMVFGMEIPLREPGETSAVWLAMNLTTEAFDLQQSLSLHEGNSLSNLWYISATASKRIARARPLSIRVLPRPPKIEIRNPSLRDQYYRNEPIELEFEILNEEDVDALAKLDVVIAGQEPLPFALQMDGDNDVSSSKAVGDEESKLLGASLGAIASSKSRMVRLQLLPVDGSSEYDLTLRVVYHLSTNPGTPITQTAVFRLNIVNPFEANYDLVPCVHPDPWPSLFDYEGIQPQDHTPVAATSPSPSPLTPPPPPPPPATPKGLSQAWCLTTRYASFATEDLVIHSIETQVLHSSPTVRCQTTKRTPTTITTTTTTTAQPVIKPKTMSEVSFDIVAQKSTLDDRSPSPLDLALLIKWARLPTTTPSQINTTTLPVPRFTIFGTEPRVLASVSHPPPSAPDSPRLVLLTIVIENASNHFLTFGLAMEPSEEFAFSGPKQTTLHVLPVSRRKATYRLLPLTDPGKGGRGGCWIRPGLVVRDKYFQKVLRVVPTEGMRVDKDGFLVWVP